MDNVIFSLHQRVELNATRQDIVLHTADELGYENDERIWRTNRRTTIKVFECESNTVRKRECYPQLQENNVQNHERFAVNRLIAVANQTSVIQMEFVSPLPVHH